MRLLRTPLLAPALSHSSGAGAAVRADRGETVEVRITETDAFRRLLDAVTELVDTLLVYDSLLPDPVRAARVEFEKTLQVSP